MPGADRDVSASPRLACCDCRGCRNSTTPASMIALPRRASLPRCRIPKGGGVLATVPGSRGNRRCRRNPGCAHGACPTSPRSTCTSASDGDAELHLARTLPRCPSAFRLRRSRRRRRPRRRSVRACRSGPGQPSLQPSPFNQLEVVQVDHRLHADTVLDADRNLGRKPPDSGGDRADEDRVQVAAERVASQDHHGPALVEIGEPQFTSTGLRGAHPPRCWGYAASQSVSSARSDQSGDTRARATSSSVTPTAP